MTRKREPDLRSLALKSRQVAEILRAGAILALLGANIAALTMLREPRKAVGYLNYSLQAWRMATGHGLPCRQLHDLLPTPPHTSISFMPSFDYLTYWEATYTKDAIYLALLARLSSPRAIFEIGTFRGYSALLFALNSPPASVVYTLDLPPGGSLRPKLATTSVDEWHSTHRYMPQEYLYQSDPAGEKVKQLYGDSASFDFGPYREQVDLFFIDGAHSYEYVRSDTSNALVCVRPGGFVVWHDYGRWGVNGVSRWLHQL